jgi:Skp family chaperone for outer membrane proteins
MKNYFMLRLPLLLLVLFGYLAIAQAQDSVKKAVVKKPITVVKPTTTKPGGIPINPKTGRPYSRYGYGTYARNYRERLKADSIKKATSTPASVVATTPVRQADTLHAAPAPKVDKSLYGQYQYLLTKVYNYQRPFVDAIWKNYTDTLRGAHNQLKAANDKIAEQAKTITGLQADVTAKEQALTQTDSISFLGIDLTKSSYNLIMWGLVLAIGAIAAIVIARTGGYRKEAVYRTTLYNELEEEFKTFKAKANEKEKKLARELQTERNKLDELTGRG